MGHNPSVWLPSTQCHPHMYYVLCHTEPQAIQMGRLADCYAPHTPVPAGTDHIYISIQQGVKPMTWHCCETYHLSQRPAYLACWKASPVRRVGPPWSMIAFSNEETTPMTRTCCCTRNLCVCMVNFAFSTWSHSGSVDKSEAPPASVSELSLWGDSEPRTE